MINALKKTGLALSVCLCSLTIFGQSQKVKDAIFPLESGSIHLTNHLDNDIQNSITHWNKGFVPYESFVDMYRRDDRSRSALGEVWGKAVRSGCMFYRYTRDEELKEMMKATVKEFLTTQRSNGSFSCSSIEKQPDGQKGDLWERKYTLLALVCYYNEIEQDPKVLNAMIKHADCIVAQIGNSPKVSILDQGWSPNNIESSTLMEPMMQLYNLTHKAEYLEFAKYIIDSGCAKGSNIIQEAVDNVPTYKMGGVYPKAYEMLSLFEGLVEYYRVTGDERIKTAFMNLFRNVKNDEITIIGNGGGDQPYHPAVKGEAWDNTAKEQTNPDIKRMMETCAGVTWMKFCTQILRLTGDASAVDEIEKYIYNGLLGAMKPTGDGFSYVNLLNGMKVTNVGWGGEFDGKTITCCNLNGPIGLSFIPYIAVMKSNKGPVINLYNACTVNNRTPLGKKLELQMKGDFPNSNTVKIVVNPAAAENFSMSLRMPSWSEHTQVSVNGKKVNNVIPGKYLQLTRKWKKGDTIDIRFEMKALLLDAPKGQNRAGDNFQAVKYGPIVLSRDENTDANYNQPVQIVADKNKNVKVVAEKPTLSTTRMEFEVPTTDGPIRMIDYASVNGWTGKKICTWLPMK